MKIQRHAKTSLAIALGAIAIATLGSAAALAQGDHGHGTSDPREAATAQKRNAGGLIAVVREATERYKSVAAAEADGYELQFGCVSGPDSGAMGLHYVNGPLVMDGELDATRPEIIIYEPTPGGRPRLIGADYLVLADAWNAKHSSPPEIMGQLLHLFEAPNRFGLPAFYTLHVWAWKDNPTGAFVNWHSNVSCDAFAGKNQ